MALPKIEQSIYSVTLSDGQTVEFRPYQVKEEKAIMIAKETGTQQDMVRTTKELVRACTFGKLDVDNLLVLDFEKLFLNIRAKSVSEISELLITCKECSHKEEVSINVQDCKVDSKILSEKERTVAITDTIGVVMSYPKVKGMTNVALEEEQTTETMLDAIIDCIEMIYDEKSIYLAKDSSKEDLNEFVDSLSTKQFTDMVEIIKDMPKLVIETQFDCSKCSHHNEMTLEGISNFF